MGISSPVTTTASSLALPPARSLAHCSTQLRPLLDLLLLRLTDDQVDYRVISVLRTLEEHRANLAKGTSSALLSFHLPRHLRIPGLPLDDPDYEKSDAVDFALVKDGRLSWDTSLPGWQLIGHHAEAVGLEWGGRWKKPYDPGHVQLPRAIWGKRA